MEVTFINQNFVGGGAQRVVSLISERLVRKGIKVNIITDVFTDFDYEVSKDIHIIPLYKSLKERNSFFSFLYMIKNVRSEAKKNPSIIMIGILPWMSWVMFLACIGLKNKIIASDHTSFERKMPLHIQFIRSYVYKFADAVTMLTNADSVYVGKKFKRKYILPNPLAYKCVTNIEERRKVILGIGRINDWYIKGFDLLIQAWALIAKKYPDWKLEIAGKGEIEDCQKLNTIAEEHGVTEQFSLIGFHTDIDKVMRETSIFVLSSRDEGFGLVLLEAMSQGCACVSFDCGGRQKEIILNNKQGVIIPNCDIKKLSMSMETLISDDIYRENIAIEGAKRASIYTVENITDKWIQMFNELETI